MQRTITVKGCGNVRVRPDQVELRFELAARDKIYDKAMELAGRQAEQLKEALEQVGFSKDSVKTASFDIRAAYDSARDKNNNYIRVFTGYECSHSLKLSFDFDSARLSAALRAVLKSGVKPVTDIDFTVSDPAAINEMLLRKAAGNAKRKADILCAASGVKLGKLVGIDYNWGEVRFVSGTSYKVDKGIAEAECASCDMDIEPDDIDAGETVTFVWEIE